MVYIPDVIIIMILWFMEGNFKHIEIVCRSGKFLLATCYNSSSQKLVLQLTQLHMIMLSTLP